MNVNQSTIDINAGQDLFPVAVLPGSSTLEMQMTIANFDSSIFELAEAGSMTTTNAHKSPVTEVKTVANNAITLSKTPVANSVSINGLTEASTIASGKFVVDIANKTVTFNTGEESGDIEVSYLTVDTTASEMVVDNKSSAIGTAYARYPVYSSGSDCTASGISGYVVVEIFRCRVTGHPTLGGSYKSASTFDLTLSGIKNTSSYQTGKAYSIAWIPNT